MFFDVVPNRKSPPTILIRQSYREGGKVKKRTLANITKLPPDTVEKIRGILRGADPADAPAALEARRPSLPAGDGGLHIGVAARTAGEHGRGSALRNHGLAARAPAEDREGAGGEAFGRGKPRSLRFDLGLELQPDLLAGQSRLLARRQDGAAANRVRAAVRRRRAAGRRRGVPRERVRPVRRGRTGRQALRPLRTEAGGVRRRPGHGGAGARPRGARAERLRLDLRP